MATRVSNGHPYFPTDLPFGGFYSPASDHHTAKYIGYICATAGFILTTAWFCSGRVRGRRGGHGSRLTTWERFLICWFSLSGATHILFEGAYVVEALLSTGKDGPAVNPVLTSPSIPATLWRHYALADSRYLLPLDHPSFSVVVALELLSVLFGGPLCVLAAYTTITQTNNYASRWLPRVIASTTQLCGVITYFLTSWWDGDVWTRPEPIYFWAYFISMNGPWVLIPLVIIVNVVKEMSQVGAEEGRVKREKRS